MIIGVYSSVPQSGKSTVTDYFTARTSFIKESFARSVKESLYEVLTGLGTLNAENYLWGHKKGDVIPELGVTGGQFMSSYAMSMRHMFGDDIWVNTVKNRMSGWEEDLNFIIDDMRFPNEYEMMAVTIKVERPDAEQEHGRNKSSEGQLDNFEFDYIIVNDGTKEEFEKKVSQLYLEIIKGL